MNGYDYKVVQVNGWRTRDLTPKYPASLAIGLAEKWAAKNVTGWTIIVLGPDGAITV